MKQAKISQKRRDYALRTALATVRLEGLEPDAETKKLAARVAAGEMTSKDAIKELDARYGVVR